jgi:hypothetical protein
MVLRGPSCFTSAGRSAVAFVTAASIITAARLLVSALTAFYQDQIER